MLYVITASKQKEYGHEVYEETIAHTKEDATRAVMTYRKRSFDEVKLYKAEPVVYTLETTAVF